VSIDNGIATSFLDTKTYNLQDADIAGVDVLTNKHELHYRRKYKNVPKDAFECDFLVANAIDMEITALRNPQNTEIILQKYKNFLIKVLKNLIHPTEEEYARINSLSDLSLAVQYLPRTRFDYDEYHDSKRFSFLHAVRVNLYNIFYSNLAPFGELYDKNIDWFNLTKEFIGIDNFKFIDVVTPNEEVMLKLRPKWLSLIKDTYQRAVVLIKAEEEEAIKFEDEDTKLEIQVIYRTLKESLEIAELQIQLCKTARELFLYWPEILEPGPVFMYVP
jgi:hypothetical protein